MNSSKSISAPTYPIEILSCSVASAEHLSSDRVIRVAEQIRLMGVGRTQYYELAKSPDFPEEIVLGKRARGRWLSEMIAYINSRKHRACTAMGEGGSNA
ncbi:MAG: AlpA family phage regulatory protein [Roseovarius sp.]|jgi:predicted DNA-binding transcriptional regulator AlpA|nr:AlpA family phage regulatory protein [Roseovarius sp.]